jgi:hypothetical protein
LLLSVAADRRRAGDVAGARDAIASAVQAYARIDDAESRRVLGSSIAFQLILMP